MAIQWNKVTWYSKLVAIVLFVLTFYIGFTLGKETAEVGTMNAVPQKEVVENTAPVSTITVGTQNINETNFSGTIPTFSGSSILATSAQAYVTQRIAAFKTQADTDVPEMAAKFGVGSPPATYTIDMSAKYVNSGNTESIIITEYDYSGGANGDSSYKVITASGSDGKILSLSDVIAPNKQAAFTALVQKKLDAWIPDGSTAPVVFRDEVSALTFSSFTNWTLDSQNVTLYFDQNEIGPSVLGPVAFPVSLSTIKNFLNPTFL